MKIEDITQGISYNLEFITDQKVDSSGNPPVKIFLDDKKLKLNLLSFDKTLEIRPNDVKDQEVVMKLMNKNLPRLSSLMNIEEKDDFYILTIGFRVFPSQIPLDIEFVITDDSAEKLKRQYGNNRQLPEELFRELCIIDINDMDYAVIGIHNRAEQSDYTGDFFIASKNGFVHIKREVDEEETIFFFVDRIQKRINKNDYTFRLAKGEIKFVNQTFAKAAKEETLAYLNEIGSSIEGYLNTWEKYGKIEKDMVFDKFKKTGILKFINFEYENGRFRIDIPSSDELAAFAEVLNKDDVITISRENPEQLFTEDLSVEKYQAFVKNNRDNVFDVKVIENINYKENRMYVSLIDQSSQTENLTEGYLIYSLSASIPMFQRRDEARQSILNAQSEMPHLAMILEGRPISKPRKNNYKPMSAEVKEDIFPVYDPTPMQKTAIEIALNTPDIALIQGPPGTGKTTVITAIFKRLNEISDSSSNIFGRQLLTAFQHDAVQNAVDRIEVMGLPAVKFGHKGSSARESRQIIEHSIENWIFEIVEKMYKNYPELKDDKYIVEFDKIYKNYLLSNNSLENTIELLKKTKQTLLSRLNSTMIDRLNKMIGKLELKTRNDNEIERKSLIKNIYRIPKYKAAYEDGGKRHILKAILALRNLDYEEIEEEIKHLEGFKKAVGVDEIDFEKLREIRKSLLVKLLPDQNIFSTPKQKEEVEILLSDISDSIREDFYKSRSGEEAILLEYISEFENNPLAIKNSILEYVSVVGATNQQVEGGAINEYKKDNRSYDNILIDEAARSNPLDLLIPMARVKDRIILVGDHRQLPQIIDQSIVEQIKRDVDDSNTASIIERIEKNIKESMFERLFKILKKLEKNDGIRRTITLDKQYRTHHVLGDFISENFYEKHGEVHIDSGLPDEVFNHQLPDLEDKVCVWYDVPSSEGWETPTRSKYRTVEARKIARHIKDLIDSDAAQGLNFGIITFYSRQREEIMKELSKVGITKKLDNGEYIIVDKYRGEIVNGRKIEKLRVGTVDAFQGREFDVVYLSMVRSNNLPGKTEKERFRKYGHIMVDNRLCVSMSRQKKMLIVVGDSNMLNFPESEKAITPLVNYYNLCKRDDKYGEII
ncbi:MAG: AAA domain-containing protein [bacterium]